MANVLVLGSGTQGLAIAHSLKKSGNNVVLLTSEKHNYADLSRYVDKKIRLHNININDDSKLLNELLSVIKEEQIDTLIPMGDTIAQFISQYKSELLNSVMIEVPDFDVFMRGYDKCQLMMLCDKNGYPHPKTLDLSNQIIKDSLELFNFSYPAMLKPNLTTGGRGMVKIDNFEQLKRIYPTLHEQYGDYHLQQFIRPGGRQIKVQLYVNGSKELVASSVIEKKRWYPVEGGSNCCAVSIRDDSLADMCYRILLDLNWLGFADFDLIEDPSTNRFLVMEINPRVPACIKSPIVAGINWGQVIIDGYMRNKQRAYLYKEGVVLRHLGFDVLWFLKSPNRWRTTPSWFSLFGKNIFYQDMSDWSDPLPFIVGTWNNIKKLLIGHAK